MPTDEEIEELLVLVYEGPRRRIFAYRTADDRVPALDELDAQASTTQQRYTLKFQKMGDNGQLRGEQFHRWKDTDYCSGLSAFKDIGSKTRIPSFPDGSGTMILTHMITGKKEDKIRERDQREAMKYKNEYFSRKLELKAGRRDKKARGGR